MAELCQDIAVTSARTSCPLGSVTELIESGAQRYAWSSRMPCPAAQGERYVTVPEACFRSEVHRVGLKRHPSCGRGRLKTLALVRRAARDFVTPVHHRAETSNSPFDETSRRGETRVRGLGCEELQGIDYIASLY